MKRLITLLCCALLFSCQDKVICPAFQSTYILDDSTRNAYFSYVWQLDEATRNQFLAQQRAATDTTNTSDSLGSTVAQPKTDYYAYAGEKVVPWRTQKRTKNGIIKNVFYPIKNYRLRTAPMENVLAPKRVTNNFVASDFEGAELEVDSLSMVTVDSLALDSADVIPEPVVAQEEDEGPRYLYGYDPADNFNVEQDYYNKYFGYLLVDNRPKPEPAPIDTSAVASDSTEVKEPFFKGLFKKKKKEQTEAEETPQETTEEEPTEENTEEEGEGNGG